MEGIKKSEAEQLKETSRFLRGNIAEELASPVARFTEESATILKFHGSYQEDDRDARKKLNLKPEDRRYMFMVRTKIPGGKITADQYLALNEIAEQYGNGTMRITVRQTIQFHGVLKRNLKAAVKSVNNALLSTFGACGDVVRNVICCPAPMPDRVAAELGHLAKQISDGLLPATRAYHEIWVDDENVTPASNAAEEPLYGSAYLPRKFKIAIAFPEDNCVDLLTNDVGLVPVVENERVAGFTVFVGGGLGLTYKRPETHPLLAQSLGFVPSEKVRAVVEGLVKIHRDYGDRGNRKRARLKYVVEDRGIDWIRAEVEKHTGFAVRPARALSWNKTTDHLGWHRASDGKNFLGVFVENGRIKDAGLKKIKTAFKTVVEKFKPTLFLTPQQNILFSGLADGEKAAFESELRSCGVPLTGEISETRRWSMACVAFPTCNLAITESERVLPDIITALEKEVARLGLENEQITIRMTGCPNGCARPSNAEIAMVGIGADKYVIYLGGNFEGTRLNRPFKELVAGKDIVSTLVPMLEDFRINRHPGERFGDFSFRWNICA